MATMSNNPQPACGVFVRVDARRYDIAVLSLDATGLLHVAVHGRASYAELLWLFNSHSAVQSYLDVNDVPRRVLEAQVVTAREVEIVSKPYMTHNEAATVIEQLRLAAGLLRTPDPLLPTERDP